MTNQTTCYVQIETGTIDVPLYEWNKGTEVMSVNVCNHLFPVNDVAVALFIAGFLFAWLCIWINKWFSRWVGK